MVTEKLFELVKKIEAGRRIVGFLAEISGYYLYRRIYLGEALPELRTPERKEDDPASN